jgi:hypothetical protein
MSSSVKKHLESKVEHPIARLALAKLDEARNGALTLSEESIVEIVRELAAFKSVAERERGANALMTMAGLMITDQNGAEAAGTLMDIATRAFWSGSISGTEADRDKAVKAAAKVQVYSLAATAPHVDAKPPSDTVTLRKLAVPPRRMRP